MSKDIKVALVGIGNGASVFTQALELYDDDPGGLVGVMTPIIGKYEPAHIDIVTAVDIDERKVGRPLEEAIYAKPNVAPHIYPVRETGIEVLMGPVMDGVCKAMNKYSPDERFIPSPREPVDVARAFMDSGARIVVSFLPTGSKEATEYYAQAAIDAGCAYVNCIPEFIASDPTGKWPARFREAYLPVLGDDIKGQIGATIFTRYIAYLIDSMRGCIIDPKRSRQENWGGGGDFMNLMASDERIETKTVSKTEAVTGLVPKTKGILVRPAGYRPDMGTTKEAQIDFEGESYAGFPFSVKTKLVVDDKSMLAACVTDLVRLAQVALDKGVYGPVHSTAGYFKHPPRQVPEEEASVALRRFIVHGIDVLAPDEDGVISGVGGKVTMELNPPTAYLNHLGEQEKRRLAEIEIAKGQAMRLKDDYPAALSHFEGAIGLSEEIGDKVLSADAYLGIAHVRELEGNLGEEERILRGISDILGMKSPYLYREGCLQRLQGNHEGAFALYNQCLDRAEDEHWRGYGLRGMAEALRLMGRHEEAYKLVQEASEILAGYRGSIWLKREFASHEMSRGNPGRARELFNQSRLGSSAMGNLNGEAHAIVGMAAASEEPKERDALYAAAEGIYERTGSSHGLGLIESARLHPEVPLNFT